MPKVYSDVCLFPYFGSKRKMVRFYPLPLHNRIVEPFAGAATYSCRYYDRQVVLYEKDPVVFGVLDYLIRSSPKEIMALPLVDMEPVDDFKIPQEAKWLIGFWLMMGSPKPTKKRNLGWASSNRRTHWGPPVRARVADSCRRIKHWSVFNKPYEAHLSAFASPSTWFVDPPYQYQGSTYVCGTKEIDYGALGRMCRALPGQVMVCESNGADWLPFRRLCYNGGQRKMRSRYEVIWTKNCNDKQTGFGFYDENE